MHTRRLIGTQGRTVFTLEHNAEFDVLLQPSGVHFRPAASTCGLSLLLQFMCPCK